MLPILILMIGVPAIATILFFVMMALLASAARAERQQLRRMRYDPSAQPFPLNMSEAFDPEHAALWSPQILALRHIAAAGERGVSYDDLYRAAYRKSAAQFPELFEGASFAEWLRSLQSAELIAITARRVLVTPLGRNFLHTCSAEITGD